MKLDTCLTLYLPSLGQQSRVVTMNDKRDSSLCLASGAPSCCESEESFKEDDQTAVQTCREGCVRDLELASQPIIASSLALPCFLRPVV